MRFIVYLAGLSVFVFFVVSLFRVALKRTQDKTRMQRDNYQQMYEDAHQRAVKAELAAEKAFVLANNALIINDTDLTAMQVVDILKEYK